MDEFIRYFYCCSENKTVHKKNEGAALFILDVIFDDVIFDAEFRSVNEILYTYDLLLDALMEYDGIRVFYDDTKMPNYGISHISTVSYNNMFYGVSINPTQFLINI